MQNVRDFGATGDGKTSDTQAIQRAIDAGGEVVFPPGIYKSGTIYLRSHTGLRLEPGAVLLSGGDGIAIGALAEDVILTPVVVKQVMLDFISEKEEAGEIIDYQKDGRVVMED